MGCTSVVSSRLSSIQFAFLTLFVVHNLQISASFKYEPNIEPPSFAFVTSGQGGNGPPGGSEGRFKTRFPSDSPEPAWNSESRLSQRQLFHDEDDDDRYRPHNSLAYPEAEQDWLAPNNDDPLKSGKTIKIPPLPTLDVIEDPGYDHNRPKWPMSEYLSDKINSFYRPNHYNDRNKTTQGPIRQHPRPPHGILSNQDYEWQQLQPSPHFGNKASGSRVSFDSSKYFSLDDDLPNIENDHRGGNHVSAIRLRNNFNLYGFGHGPYDTPREHVPLSNHHEATVSTTMGNDAKGSGTNVIAAESSKRGHEKHGGFTSGPHGNVPYFPPDYYPKKRFRLSIHPGYIAAPVAGLAAFGVASALAKKPIMLELGLVNNKHHYGHHKPHGPHQGWPSTHVPVYPGGGYPINSGDHQVHPNVQYPILKPEASHNHVTSTNLNGHLHLNHHYHHHPESYTHHRHPHHVDGKHHQVDGHNNHHNSWPSQQGHQQPHNHHQHHGWASQQGHQPPHHVDKKPWWNPFAALTPRA